MQRLTSLCAMAFLFLTSNGCYAQSPSLARANQIYAQKDYAGLAAFSADWVKKEPHNYDAWCDLAVANAKLKHPKEAIAAFTKASEIKPNDPGVWHSLAVAYSMTDDIDDACKVLTQGENNCVAARTMSADWWYNYGNDFANAVKIEHARQDYEKALAANPRLASAWNNCGLLYEATGHTQKARVFYQKAGALGDKEGSYNAKTLQSRIDAAKARARVARMGSSSGNSIGRLLNYMQAQNQAALNEGRTVPYGGH